MKRIFLAVVLAGFAHGALAQGAAAQGAAAQGTAAPKAPAGDAARGGQLFAADGCYECHGYVGQGSIRTGPALAPNTIPMSAILAQLRKPADRMPAYTAVVLPDADVADIYAYLTSLPKPPNPADLPLLQN